MRRRWTERTARIELEDVLARVRAGVWQPPKAYAFPNCAAAAFRASQMIAGAPLDTCGAYAGGASAGEAGAHGVAERGAALHR